MNGVVLLVGGLLLGLHKGFHHLVQFLFGAA